MTYNKKSDSGTSHEVQQLGEIMKARFIAPVLTFCVALPLYAANTTPTPVAQAPTQTTVKQKINLNTADISALTGSVKGIGKKRAEAIIAYRDSHQGFKAIEELAEVKGIGQHFILANREKLSEVFEIK